MKHVTGAEQFYFFVCLFKLINKMTPISTLCSGQFMSCYYQLRKIISKNYVLPMTQYS